MDRFKTWKDTTVVDDAIEEFVKREQDKKRKSLLIDKERREKERGKMNNTDFLRTGNWRGASRDVRAQNDELFIDLHALELAIRYCPGIALLERLLGSLLDRTIPITVSFATRRLAERLHMIISTPDEDIEDHELSVVDFFDRTGLATNSEGGDLEWRELWERAMNRDLDALTAVYRIVANGERRGDNFPFTHYDLCLRLQLLVSPAESVVERAGRLSAVINWLHSTGSLFTGSATDSAPLTEVTANYLSSAGITLRRLLEGTSDIPRASDRIRNVLERYRSVWEAAEKAVDNVLQDAQTDQGGQKPYESDLKKFRDMGREGQKKVSGKDGADEIRLSNRNKEG